MCFKHSRYRSGKAGLEEHAINDCLTKLGNAKVEYIRTTGRGLHSWNIVDPADLAAWIEQLAPSATGDATLRKN